MQRDELISAKSILSLYDPNSYTVRIDDDLRKDLHDSLFNMYKDILSVCDRHGIKLFLCGGSALGAVRHNGFIPWDDDLDTAMTREDYLHFQDIFEGELSDRYILKAPRYQDGSRSRFPKVLKKGTVFREIGNPSPEDECGLFLDIFILDNVPENPIYRRLKGFLCNILEFIGGQVLLVEENNIEAFLKLKKRGRLQYFTRKIIGKFFSFIKIKGWNCFIDRVVQYNKTSALCTLATGRKHYFGETLPRETFLPGRKGFFEGQEVLLFENVDRYLTNLYGDYMKIPDEAHREQHFVEEIKL